VVASADGRRWQLLAGGGRRCPRRGLGDVLAAMPAGGGPLRCGEGGGPLAAAPWSMPAGLACCKSWARAQRRPSDCPCSWPDVLARWLVGGQQA